MHTHDQSSIFSTGGKFCPDYGLLFELHTLTLFARSYALLMDILKPVSDCLPSSVLLLMCKYHCMFAVFCVRLSACDYSAASSIFVKAYDSVQC